MIILLTVLWGVNWPIMKIGLGEYTVLSFRSLATIIGASCLFGLVLLQRKKILPEGADLKMLLIASALNILGWNSLMLLGLSFMTSGRAAILGFTMPAWAVLIAVIAVKAKLTNRQIAGLAAGMTAIAILLYQDFASLNTTPWGALIMIAAAICWGAGTVVMRHADFRTDLTVITAWQHAIGIIPILIITVLFDDMDYRTVSLWPTLALIYNGVIASFVCYWIWFRIASYAPVVVSAVSTLMVPVLGVFSGMIVLGEQVRSGDIVALGLVALAVLLVLIPARNGKQI